MAEYDIERLRLHVIELEVENDTLRMGQAAAMVREQHHQAITGSAVDLAIIATDWNGRVTDWNKGAERVLGWSAEEMHGQRVNCLYTLEDRSNDCMGAEMRQAVDKGRVNDERWHMKKDGAYFWAATETVPLQGEDGSHLGFVKLLRDRTTQKLADMELRAREAQFSAALTLAKLGTFEWNLATTDVRLDDRSRTIFDFAADGGICAQDLFDRIEPADLDSVLMQVQASRQAMSRLACEYRINLPGNRVRTIVSIGDAMPGAGGQVERLVGVFADVTERRQAEAALQGLNQALEQRVEARTSELQASEERLRQSQKMEAVGQLTGGLAHDFNNLLSVISGSLELLQTRLTQGQTFDLDHYIASAQGASRRAAALTHRLLAFCRQQALDSKPANVNRLAGDMADLIRRTLGPGVAVNVVAADGLWTIQVDQNQLENALLNLCINAGHAMANHGALTIETANLWLDAEKAGVCEVPVGQYVSLCITDTGVGMTAEVIKRAFDPYFTTKPVGQGSGLGLSMVYGFCRQSGGHARITSEPGKPGTTVCLYLPRHMDQPDDRQAPAAVAPSIPAARGKTVLVVEDEPTLQDLVAEVLEELGYATIKAAEGAAGLKALQSDAQIDLLVSDIGLPGGMDGRQLTRAGQVLRPGLKVLLITGYAESAALENSPLDAGTQMLTKPFTMTALADRVRDILAASDAASA